MSQSALDEAESAVEQAENRQRAASGQLVIARARVTEATANVAQARAAVERAEEELANATIKAPIRATVLTRDVEIGSPVSSILNLGANATLVMTLGDIEQVFVRGKVDEADIGRVRLGQPAKITTEIVPATRSSRAASRRSRRSASRRTTSRRSRSRCRSTTPAKELKANMTANAEIILEEFPNSLLLPEAAITFDDKRNAFGERRGRRARRAAAAGRREGWRRQRHAHPDHSAA